MGLLTPSSLEAGGRKQKINAYNILILCLLGPASIVYGYAAAIIATTFGQPSFITYFGLDVKTNASSLIGAMSALFFVGGFIGPLCLPPLADRFGRKWSIFASLVLTTIAAAFMAGSTNVGEFIFFRFVSGAGAFMLLAAIPLLMNEVVPSSMRGGLVELHAVFFIAGFMIASWIGFGFSFWTRGGIDAWRPPLAIQAGWSLLAMVALYWVPESPRWLIMKGQEAKAQAILEKLHSDASDPDHEFAKAEFYQIVKQLHIDKTLGNSWMHIIKKPSYRKRAIIAVLLTSFIQSSGDLVINNYGPILYANLGYSTTKQLLYPSAWLTFTFGISVLAMPLIDRVARNVLVAVGLWGTMCCLIVEAALVAEFVDKAPATADAKPNNNALQAAVAMFFVFQVFDTAMLNGPEWAYLGEIFPTHIRAKGMCLAISFIALTNICYTQAAPVAFQNVGWKFYVLFIVLTFIGGFVVLFFFPDTRGKPLEEIAALFGDADEVAIYEQEIVIDAKTHEVVAVQDSSDSRTKEKEKGEVEHNEVGYLG